MLAAMGSNIETIFVQLLDEGTDVMRPVSALLISDDIYEIMAVEDYDPDYEIWEFLPGSKVRCETRGSGDETFLVAVEEIVDKS